MNCFHLSLLPVCVRVSFSAGAGGTIPRCDLHSDMRWIFHFFQRAEETIFLRNGRENLHQQQSTDHLAGAAHVGKGFGFFPHSKQLMGQSTGDLENRRQKNSANLSELPRPVSLGWKSLGNRFCQESPVFSGSPSAQDTGTRKQPLGTSALGLAIVSRSWKKMGSKPRCFQTLRHIWFLLPWCGPAGSTQTSCLSHLSQQELSDVSLPGESITSDADLMSL